MALVVKNRVRETSTTAGTGTITLAGAVSGFQSFSVIGNGNTTYYTIVDSLTGAWEVGIGTYTSSGATLSRDTVLASSNSGNLVNFSANGKDVFCTYPAERSAYADGSTIASPAANLTANRVMYATSTSAIGQSANLTFDGTTLTTTAISDSGNLTFTGTGNRITGDFSNATLANRVMFQTSTANGASVVGVLPNGTGTITQFAAYGGSDPANAQVFRFDNRGGSESRIESTYAGTPTSGTYLPITFYTGGSERMRIDSNGNFMVGTATALATLTVNGNITPSAAPSSVWGLDFAPSASAGAYVTIANNGTYDLATGSGKVIIYDDAGTGAAEIMCVYGVTNILWQYNSVFTVTSGTASKINVYYNSGTGKYRIQNLSGSSKSLYISTIRNRLTS